MRKIGCVSITEEAEKLKKEKDRLRTETEKSLLKYAEACEAMGSWYRREGYEEAAPSEFGEASKARDYVR